MPVDAGQIAARRRLGAELRRLREIRDMTGEALADLLGWSQSKVSRIEHARTLASIEDVRAFGVALKLPKAVRQELQQLATEAAGAPGDWRNSSRMGLTRRQQDFISLEASARRIKHYQPALLPGYIQTPAYARRVIEIAGASDVERALEARLARRSTLVGLDAPTYEVVLLESALRWRPFSYPEMREQLELLATLSSRPNVTVRIVSFDREQTTFVQHPFMIFEFGGELPPEALIETTTQDLRLGDRDSLKILDKFFARLTSSSLTASDSLDLIWQEIHAIETREEH